MARNVRDAFTGLFSDTALNIHGTEDTAKQFAEKKWKIPVQRARNSQTTMKLTNCFWQQAS